MVSASANVRHVAVLMGGQSAERDVSLESGRTVLQHLADDFSLTAVEIAADGRWFLDGVPYSPTAAIARLQESADALFNALHGPMGEDGSMQGLCRQLCVPLTGPDVIPAAVTMDKRLSKLVMEGAGIATPKWFIIEETRRYRGAEAWRRWCQKEFDARAAAISLPWVFKPNRLGSSVGIDILESREEILDCAPKLAAAAAGDDILVEELIEGRELSIAVLELDGVPEVLPPIELRPIESSFFDYHAKYTPGATEELCPAPLTEAERDTVAEVARRVHQLFRCEPLSRVDMFLRNDGSIVVLEINTLPGLTATSLVPLAASRQGIVLRDLFRGLIDHAVTRETLRDLASSPEAAGRRQSLSESATVSSVAGGASSNADPIRRE